LIRVERELAREAGIKIGEWHKAHPLESLDLGQYNTYKTASEVSIKPAKPEATSADHRLNQIRAEAVGLPVTQLRDIEQDIAEKAGMSTVAWRKQHPFESLTKGQYDIHKDGPAVLAKRNTQSLLEKAVLATHHARANATGIRVEKLKTVERKLSKEAGLQLGKWREQHPLESLYKGQYDGY
jgi:hypothetical protein